MQILIGILVVLGILFILDRSKIRIRRVILIPLAIGALVFACVWIFILTSGGGG